MQLETTHNISKQLFRPKAFAKKHSDKFSSGQISWLVKQRHNNGLSNSGAVIKISGKLYIIESKFFDSLINQEVTAAENN